MSIATVTTPAFRLSNASLVLAIISVAAVVYGIATMSAPVVVTAGLVVAALGVAKSLTMPVVLSSDK